MLRGPIGRRAYVFCQRHKRRIYPLFLCDGHCEKVRERPNVHTFTLIVTKWGVKFAKLKTFYLNEVSLHIHPPEIPN